MSNNMNTVKNSNLYAIGETMQYPDGFYYQAKPTPLAAEKYAGDFYRATPAASKPALTCMSGSTLCFASGFYYKRCA